MVENQYNSNASNESRFDSEISSSNINLLNRRNTNANVNLRNPTNAATHEYFPAILSEDSN